MESLLFRIKRRFRWEWHKHWDNIYWHFCFTPKVMTTDEVVDYILSNNASIARIGDGELSCMYGKDLRFQVSTPLLQQKMYEVCKCNDPRLLIGIPDTFDHLERYNEAEQYFWRSHFYYNRHHWMQVLKKGKLYANTFLSRFYSMEWDKELAAHRISQLRRLWEGRDIIFIEGKDSKIGVGNDLFDNAASIRRIIGPSKNAFEKYDALLSTALQLSQSTQPLQPTQLPSTHSTSSTPSPLFILALGPTATILAYELCMQGCQALDLGHMDIEYEWYKMGATSKVPVTGKFSNEAAIIGGLKSEVIGALKCEEYEGQIVLDLSSHRG